MYDSNMGTTALSGSSALAVTGMAVSSWILIAVALLAMGGTLIAMAKRFKHRKGAKP